MEVGMDVQHEQDLIADHLMARMNEGVDPDVLAEALNTMMIEISQSGGQTVGQSEAVH